MTFKALTNRLPDYVHNFFTRCENSNYSLRSNNVKLSLPNNVKLTFLKDVSLIEHHMGGTNYRMK